ncbi:MAG: hypothetical protein IJD17_01235, partial [Clostridia bacterium]|nr:hypothetical protein [Clostridia bacterium]
MSRKTNLNTDAVPAKTKFPIVWVLMILLSFTMLIYSAVSIVIFYTSIDSATAPEAEVSLELDEVGVTEGNMQFTTKEVFNIEDPQSSGATFLLFTFCTLCFASLSLLFFSYKGIARRDMKRAIKALIM